MEEALAERTRYLTVALEDIYQSHNASACLRSCEILGVQDIHIVEERNRYHTNPDVEMGASRWLSLRRYNQGEERILQCISQLRRAGYRILAASPAPAAVTPWNVELDQPLAIVFGAEEQGLSALACERADGFLHLPMYGFTQSFNISVTLAITISTIMERLRRSDHPWRLSQREMDALRLQWMRRNLRSADQLERRYLSQRSRSSKNGA